MKVKFYLDNGANIHSCRDTEWFDPVDYLGLEQGEWELMSEEDKHEMVRDEMNQYVDMGFEESED
tara:strand:+ start:63 stop:257 length:195 start_codon:yes stop_codon:yes gene_type:complete